MSVLRPNQERFDMTREENIAFWLMIVAEYSHKSVRENSLMLYNNGLVRDDNAG